MNQSLKKSVDSGLIDNETALNYTTAQDELTKMLGLKEGKKEVENGPLEMGRF